jgi:hypothetical protein
LKDIRENVIGIKFYIPNEQYTGLTETTKIKCSSFVLLCTISAGTLDLTKPSIEMAKEYVPNIELHWKFSDVIESDPVGVTCKPGPEEKTEAELTAFYEMMARSQ